VQAGSLICGGYFLAWLALQDKIYSTYILMGIFFAMVGLGSGTLYTAAVSPNIENFEPVHRGKVFIVNSNTSKLLEGSWSVGITIWIE
jgi:hypothetical protein